MDNKTIAILLATTALSGGVIAFANMRGRLRRKIDKLKDRIKELEWQEFVEKETQPPFPTMERQDINVRHVRRRTEPTPERRQSGEYWGPASIPDDSSSSAGE